MDDAHGDFLIGELLQGFRQRFDAAVDVGLQNQVEFAQFALLDLLVELLEGDASRRLGFAGALVLLAPGGDVARFAIVGSPPSADRLPAARRRMPTTCTGAPGSDFLDAPTAFVEQCAHAPA